VPTPRPIPGQILTNARLTGSAPLTNAKLQSPTISGALTVSATATFTGALTASGDVSLGDGDDTLTIGQSGDTVDCAGNWGWFGATAVGQQSALTTQHAALTQSGTDNADVTIQAATNSSPYGFANADEFEAVVASLINLMTRVQELEDALQAYGLLA